MDTQIYLQLLMGSHLPCSHIHKHKSFCLALSTHSSLGSPAQFSPNHNHCHDFWVDGEDDNELDDQVSNHGDHDDHDKRGDHDDQVDNDIYGNEDISIIVDIRRVS